MKKIALPTVNDKLSSHFGHASHFVIYSLEDNKIINEEKHPVPFHEPGSFPRWLSEFGVEIVLLGGVGQKAIEIFQENNIEVIMGITKEKPQEVIQEYIKGVLVSKGNVCDH